MFRKFYCTYIALLVSASLFAQNTYVVELNPTAIDLAGRQFYIDSVVDDRLMKENIGEVHVGGNNKTATAVFANSFVETMTSYFKATVPMSAGQTRLVAVIRELQVYEKIYKAKEHGVADVIIVFCKLDSGILKAVGETSDSEESGGLDVTATQGKRIDLAIKECLKSFHSTNWKDDPGTLLGVTETWDPNDPERNILRAKTLKYGTFRNFNQLLSNSPANTEKMLVPESEPGELVLIRKASTKKKLIDAYAFTDGTHIYMNTFFYNGVKSSGAFAKVEVVGPYLGWFDYYQSAAGAAAVSVAFGAIGAAVAGSDIDAIVLELKTGSIIVLRPESLSKILEPDPSLLAEYQKSRKQRDPAIQMRLIQRFNELHPDL